MNSTYLIDALGLSGDFCADCGERLMPGPLGPGCIHCSLVLALGGEGDGLDDVKELFPELEIGEVLARGGFGVVCRAMHRSLQRPVALKLLDVVLARSPQVVEQFSQEMAAVGALDHAGIVRAYDAGMREGEWFLIMEFVDGQDCGALVRKHGRLPVVEACGIVRDTALALQAAHEKGLLHRDLKPGNVMLTRPLPGVVPAVKVLDFGLARLMAEAGDGVVSGTLAYASPEQISEPDTVDARSDVFSLGATLWRFLTGETIYPEAGGLSFSRQWRDAAYPEQPIPSLGSLRPDLPAGLVRLCDRMLLSDRRGRPAGAGEVARLLAPWAEGADFGRLFEEGPLGEKPFVKLWKDNGKWGWMGKTALGLASVGVLAGGLLAASGWGFGGFFKSRERLRDGGAPEVSVKARPGISAAGLLARHFDESTMPVLHDNQWEARTELLLDDPKYSARMMPGGEVAFLMIGRIWAWQPDAPKLWMGPNGKGELKGIRLLVETPDLKEVGKFTMDPESGRLVFAVKPAVDLKTLHFHDASGREERRVAYDFQKSAAPLVKAMAAVPGSRAVLEGYPWGMAYVTAGNVPAGSGLNPGDVLLADEGHEDIYPGLESNPGLWKCRWDSDAPAVQIGVLPRGNAGGISNYPVDVTVGAGGVFLLSRSGPVPPDPNEQRDRNERVWRWEAGEMRPCKLNVPVMDPSGIVADPLSRDLFLLEGAFMSSILPARQRVLRLHPSGPDAFEVTVVIDRLGKPASCGLGISADGRQMIITDDGNRMIIVLKRR